MYFKVIEYFVEMIQIGFPTNHMKIENSYFWDKNSF